MKNLLLTCSLLLGSLGAHATDYSGNWRGVLQLAPEVGIVLGMELTQTADGYQLVLLSPNQSMEEMLPTSFSLKGNTLQFTDEKLRATFKGQFDGDSLSGVFQQGRDMPITLKRLSAADTARLSNEQQWFGELQLSRSATLPLVLNVAVTTGGYHVTLDSPKQQSYGIPVSEFSLTDKQLSFSSAMINASYQGNWQQDEWQGTFVQGQAMPLNLKKKP